MAVGVRCFVQCCSTKRDQCSSASTKSRVFEGLNSDVRISYSQRHIELRGITHTWPFFRVFPLLLFYMERNYMSLQDDGLDLTSFITYECIATVYLPYVMFLGCFTFNKDIRVL